LWSGEDLRVRGKVTRFWLRLRFRVGHDHLPRMASSLSFSTLLAAAPLLTISITILSFFPGSEARLVVFEEFVYANFIPEIGDVVHENLRDFAKQAGRLTIIGLFFLLGTTIYLLSEIEEAMDDVWHVVRGRFVFHRVINYLLVVVFGPLLMILSLAFTTYLVALPLQALPPEMSFLQRTATQLLPVLFIMVSLFLMYQLIPHTQVYLRDAIIGSIVGAVLFEVAKLGFAFYITNFDLYQVMYGALATLPLFILWVYVSWWVALFGAEVAATLGEMRGGISTEAVRPARTRKPEE